MSRETRMMMRVAKDSRSFWRQLERRFRFWLRFTRKHLVSTRELLKKPGYVKSLRLREQIALGERRSVAIVECGEETFLIGCSAQSVSLLAKLQPKREFTDFLSDHYELTKAQ